MSVFKCYYAKPGNYKSLYFSILITKLFERNKNWYEKQLKQYNEVEIPQYNSRIQNIKKWDIDKIEKYKAVKKPRKPRKRKIATNMNLSQKALETMDGYIYYWEDMDQIVKLKDVDLVIDEIAEFMDAREFELMSRAVKRFLSQYRRLGIHIYGNTQHWTMIDKRARLMFTNVYKMMKVIGNTDPSPTRPKIKKIWGLGAIFPVENFESEDEIKMKVSFMGVNTFFVHRKHIEMYDTREIIANRDYPPLKHIVQKCEFAGDPDHVCNHIKIIHK